MCKLPARGMRSIQPIVLVDLWIVVWRGSITVCPSAAGWTSCARWLHSVGSMYALPVSTADMCNKNLVIFAVFNFYFRRL
jgi:hypothetical protein